MCQLPRKLLYWFRIAKYRYVDKFLTFLQNAVLCMEAIKVVKNIGNNHSSVVRGCFDHQFLVYKWKSPCIKTNKHSPYVNRSKHNEASLPKNLATACRIHGRSFTLQKIIISLIWLHVNIDHKQVLSFKEVSTHHKLQAGGSARDTRPPQASTIFFFYFIIK